MQNPKETKKVIDAEIVEETPHGTAPEPEESNGAVEIFDAFACRARTIVGAGERAARSVSGLLDALRAATVDRGPPMPR